MRWLKLCWYLNATGRHGAAAKTMAQEGAIVKRPRTSQGFQVLQWRGISVLAVALDRLTQLRLAQPLASIEQGLRGPCPFRLDQQRQAIDTFWMVLLTFADDAL